MLTVAKVYVICLWTYTKYPCIGFSTIAISCCTEAIHQSLLQFYSAGIDATMWTLQCQQNQLLNKRGPELIT